MSETQSLVPDAPINDRNKRKRKKSFLKNARKYAKKGHFGRGSQLEADTYQYFVRIMEAYREGFDTAEDKAIFVNNVFEQTVGQEITCCCNQVGCRVVEMLLPFANEAVIQRFMAELSKDMRPLCGDRFASHVLEALVTHSTNVCLRPGAGDSPQYQLECKNFTIKVSKFLLNNLEDYLWDTYATHVVRTCLENLAQIPHEKDKKLQQYPVKRQPEELELPEEFVEIVREYGGRVLAWPQFLQLPDAEASSGFLQVLLKTLKRVDSAQLKRYLSRLNKEKFGDDPAELSVPAVMVLETAVTLASRKTLAKLYARNFAGRLVKLATARATNFAVQKLVAAERSRDAFEAVFDELADGLGEVIAAGHTGVVWALGEACRRLGARQGAFLLALMRALDCHEPEERQREFVVCLARFRAFSANDACEGLHREKLNLHGTLLLQILLDFNKPIKIVNGLLGLDASVVRDLFSNTMGSHIVDSYVRSVFVGEKSREKLTRKMKGTYQDLASTKFGSRSFEALWNASNIKTKLAIMDEMVHKDGAWSNSEHGKIIAAKINLNLYKRNKDDWQNSLNTSNKADKLFSDILK